MKSKERITPTAGTSSSGDFACATATQRTLKDLRTKRKGQPVLVVGHVLERKGQEAAFELFNVRLAVVKFADGVLLGFDPLELLLPTEIDDKGVAYFEIRQCATCDQQFPLTTQEVQVEVERTHCPECAPAAGS
ncbi:MAG: hypothetical protein ACREJU_15980 [Nitrospiraceae bacterium]